MAPGGLKGKAVSEVSDDGTARYCPIYWDYHVFCIESDTTTAYPPRPSCRWVATRILAR